MALKVTAATAPAQVNGTTTPTPAEDEQLYDQLLRLRDVVVAGKHASFKLPIAALAELKASVVVPDSQDSSTAQPSLSTASNAISFTTNQTQLPQSSSFPTFSGLPGLQAAATPFLNGSAHVYGTKPASAAGLNPIFLEKSDSLVRAEGQLKRQRLDRDLQTQVDQRKHTSRDKDSGADAPSPIDIDLVLLTALERVKPISGLKATPKTGSAASSSFDENDYYSSQVQSDWSSEAGSSKGSDKATGAFTADFERLDGALQAPSSHPKRSIRHGKEPTIPTCSSPSPRMDYSQADADDPDDVYDPEDEDDDYIPPDATAFDSFQENGSATQVRPVTPPEDNNSDYEPGEITQESNGPTSHVQAQQANQRSPKIPVIRNHLTHIAAPQPNRVSPLATAKGPSIELELVNGRPELVQKAQPRPQYVHSRASSNSPSGNGVSGSGKKRRNKKRKRDNENTRQSKRRRERHNAFDSPASPATLEPYIKDEPVSPPPYGSLAEAPQYNSRSQIQYRPAQVDLVSPRYAQQVQYAPEPSRSGLRYEYAQPEAPTVVRVASPSTHRPIQRDTQDLRRVASLHHAQRPPSPARVYSPVGPYRNASMTHAEPSLNQPGQLFEDKHAPKHMDQSSHMSVPHVRSERSRSPPRVQEYRDPYATRASSPALMPPPPSTQRQIITDAYGNRYYAVDAAPAPAPAPLPRASIAPIDRRPQPEVAYERTSGYLPATSTQLSGQYEAVDNRMAPPSVNRRQVVSEQQIEYVDANGYRIREYNPRLPEPSHYAEAPTSPIYQQVRGYEQMLPPSQPTREPTSPSYAPRSYSVHPEQPQPMPSNYIRQVSAAPVQYVRQEAPPPPPARAVSVMPGMELGASTQPPQRAYMQAPQSVIYVDQYGHEVYPQQVRQVSDFRYQ